MKQVFFILISLTSSFSAFADCSVLASTSITEKVSTYMAKVGGKYRVESAKNIIREFTAGQPMAREFEGAELELVSLIPGDIHISVGNILQAPPVLFYDFRFENEKTTLQEGLPGIYKRDRIIVTEVSNSTFHYKEVLNRYGTTFPPNPFFRSASIQTELIIKRKGSDKLEVTYVNYTGARSGQIAMRFSLQKMD